MGNTKMKWSKLLMRGSHSVLRNSAVLFFLVAAPHSWAAVYDAAASFEAGFTSHSNPNGVWSYGYSSGFTAPVTLYTQTSQPGVHGPNAQYWSSTPGVTATSSVQFNDGPLYNDGNVDISASGLTLVWFGAQYSDLVFTAPTTGTYSLAGVFLGSQNNVGSVVAVVANGSIVFNSTVTSEGQTVPFNATVALTAGSTVLFSAGPGGGNQNTGLSATITGSIGSTPSLTAGGVFPVGSAVPTIEPGEWVSIYGNNLASSTVIWNGDFPTSLGGTSVTIDGKAAYLSFVSPTQINLQAPSDATTGSVPVVVTTASGTATSTVTLAQFAPSFLLLDSKHVAGIILRSDGSGAYGGGTYDLLGPTGSSLGYPTVAAKAGDNVEIFATGLGPTSPAEPVGQAFSSSAPTTYPVTLLINNVSVAPAFAGLSGAGLYQINLIVPNGLGTGDVPLVAVVGTTGGSQTPPNVVISLN
jgi:uncharacterized protein (TIGR03437 family)